jgi:diguanylate cyclase (GGDEF)-like protein/PAS domain S-box-containing protein
MSALEGYAGVCNNAAAAPPVAVAGMDQDSRLQLCIVETPGGAPRAAADGVGPPRHDEASVLLVNDDPGTLFALRAALSDLEASVVTAGSGEQALLCLLRQDFAVVLLDVKMAGLNGFETAQLIRQRPRSYETPIIFLTARRSTDLDRTTGYGLGAVDYLFMPVSPDVLRAKVQVFIERARAHSRQAPAEPQPAHNVRHLSDAWRSVAALRKLAGNGWPHDPDAPSLLLEHAGDFMAMLDADGRWLDASAGYQRQFATEIQAAGRYVDIVHDEDRERVAAALAAVDTDAPQRRLQYRVRGGLQQRHLETEATLVDASGAARQLVLVSRDITERKEMEAYVLQQTMHDALTGLPNRLLLQDRLSQAMASREDRQATVALLFVDLDHFKEVNDTLGHAAGDRLLQDVAERLSSCVRDGDTVARLGGDEFVVVLLGLHDAGYAGMVAGKIVDTVSATCHIEGSALRVTPSIGIAIFPDDAADVETLLRRADIAMYNAKQDGGARYCFFTAQMQEAASRKLMLGSALQRAMAMDEFLLYYQPKVDAASGAICGFEALMRWPQAGGEPIPPSLFIPVAEETGRIERIGAWAIEQTAAQLNRWAAHGYGQVPIAVNVSAQQFRRDTLVTSLAAAAQAASVDPRLLEVELTESGVMSNPARAIETLQRLHGIGMSIAIDDFGTGYSSLAYLKRLPIDKLKIDASFVRDIANNPSDAAIVMAIITLGHVLHLTVIAEGVETADQVAFLRAHGCDQMQGHYFSAAVAAEEALALLRRGPFRLAPLDRQGAAP